MCKATRTQVCVEEGGEQPFVVRHKVYVPCVPTILLVRALDLLVDVKETDLVHGGEFCDQVDDSCDQVDKESEGGIVGVVGAEQKPMLANGKQTSGYKLR